MTIEQMRNRLMYNTQYSESVSWQDKVKHMSPTQVYAIYISFRKNNKFKAKRKTKPKEEFHQITIYEYLEGINA